MEMMKKQKYKVYTKAMALLAATCLWTTPIHAKTNTQFMPTMNLRHHNVDITLKPGNAGSLAGRTFEVFKIFDVVVSANQSSYAYSFCTSADPTQDAKKQLAIQTVVARWYNKNKPIGQTEDKTPEQIDINTALHYIESLQTKNGQLESDTSMFRIFVQDLRDELNKQGVKADRTEVVGKEHTANQDYVVSNLEKGYYLIDEVNADHTSIAGAQSLIMVSTVEGNQDIELKGNYPVVEKKIHEDDNNVGWNDIGDYEIGQEIPYQFKTTVPPIRAYAEYKMIFHDQMDTALQLDVESIQVQLISGDQTVRLNQDQFQVVTDAKRLEPGETFQIRIENLKTLIDQNFYASQKDESKKTYGQTVQVSYQAKLKESAAALPGRPGFENKVKLEYSNNPDRDGQGDTGSTLWDSVVAFTFNLSGTKISAQQANGQYPPLAHAHFRLYRDQNCRNEIGLKKVIQEDQTYYVVDPSGTSKEELITQADGKIAICGLDGGTYYLKETKAPEGFHGPLTPIQLDIKPVYTTNRNEYVAGSANANDVLKDLTGEIAYQESYDGQSHSVDITLEGDQIAGNLGTIIFDVINRTGKELPMTGENGVWFYLISGSFVCGLGIAIVLVSKSRKHSS